MRHQWKDETEQGFWPEIVDGQHCAGCICWRCWTGCRLELPNTIMAPIYEQEWLRLQFLVECDPVFGVGNWDDSADATRAKEIQVYNEEDFSHLYVWCNEAPANILTVHP
jgi:hypothetical protein